MNLSLGAANRPERLWLLASALALLGVLAWLAFTVLSMHRGASARLADIEPRHARIAGLLQSNDRLAKSAQTLKADLSQYIYPADGDPGQIGNQALQKVRDIAAAREMRITSSQVAAAREEHGFERIGLTLRVEGEWPQLQSLLGELARQRPAIYINAVQIGGQGGYVEGRPFTVWAQFDLYALKERGP
ncbi:MAG: type II secretion system protein M [Burkholderiaceae bacterium]|jgi:general secretion pathway protein M|nr:type II secretion system protein M [Burkholderiaceae bacterium]